MHEAKASHKKMSNDTVPDKDCLAIECANMQYETVTSTQRILPLHEKWVVGLIRSLAKYFQNIKTSLARKTESQFT